MSQTRRSGATTSAPSASPTHHVHHRRSATSQGCAPPAHRATTPIVALIVVLAPATRMTSPSASLSRASAGRAPLFARSQAPTTASSVLPAAIPSAVPSGSWEVMLATKAPMAMPSQVRRGPRSTVAASAIPVGGQTGLTCAAIDASDKPILAAATYTAAVAAMTRAVRAIPPAPARDDPPAMAELDSVTVPT